MLKQNIETETARSCVIYIFRHWNSPKSCQHFKGEVEHGRGSTRGVADIQGKAPSRVLGIRWWNWVALGIWHICFNTSSLFLGKSLQITPLFSFSLSNGKKF